MIEPVESTEGTRVRQLEAEVLAMQRQVELRDELLRDLNRRLLELERGEADTGQARRIAARSRPEEDYFRRLAHSFLDTDMFRWTVPLRKRRGKKARARRQGTK